MNPLILKVSGLILIALTIFGFGYRSGSAHVQAKWNVAKLAQDAVNVKAAAASRVKEQTWNKRLEDAQNEALNKQRALQADLDSVRNSSDSLQHQLSDTKRKLSAASADAVRHYSEALTDVFSQCVERYKEVARAADECDTTVNLLQEAWPQSTYISPSAVSPIGK